LRFRSLDFIEIHSIRQTFHVSHYSGIPRVLATTGGVTSVHKIDDRHIAGFTRDQPTPAVLHGR
jgi:hypothetical protein